MFDVVVSKDNEERFVAMAEKLGYTGLCFLYKNQKELNSKKLESLRSKSELNLYAGILTDEPKQFNTDLTVVKDCGRKFFESKFGDLVINLEKQPKDFMHHRSSGLNQVLCKLAKEKGKVITIDFSLILNSKDTERANILGRIMQNIVFARKYKFDLALASFATKPEDMRSPHDLKAFLITLGAHPSEASKALKSIKNKISHNLKKKSTSYLAEGVELVD